MFDAWEEILGTTGYRLLREAEPAGVAESSTIVLNRAEAMRGCREAMPPLARDFQNDQFENKPPVLHLIFTHIFVHAPLAPF